MTTTSTTEKKGAPAKFYIRVRHAVGTSTGHFLHDASSSPNGCQGPWTLAFRASQTSVHRERTGRNWIRSSDARGTLLCGVLSSCLCLWATHISLKAWPLNESTQMYQTREQEPFACHQCLIVRFIIFALGLQCVASLVF